MTAAARPPSTSEVIVLFVHIRSYLARHRAVHVGVVLAPAVVASLVVVGQLRALANDRASWGDTRTVWIVRRDLAPGQPIVASSDDLPLAAIPAAALTDDPSGRLALQRIGSGEIVTQSDVLDDEVDTRLVPPDARTVAIPTDDQGLELRTGDRVDVVAGGITLAADGIVVTVSPGAVTVAVSAAAAPLVASAALERTAVLVGRPAG
jgi:hypothetical protein